MSQLRQDCPNCEFSDLGPDKPGYLVDPFCPECGCKMTSTLILNMEEAEAAEEIIQRRLRS